MSDDTFNLDREVNLQNNIDAEGKKWVIKKQRSNGLLFVRPEPDRVDAVIPKELQGLWTKHLLLEGAVKTYLTASWNKVEVANKRKERKEQAAKEQAALAKKAKSKNDTGKSATA